MVHGPLPLATLAIALVAAATTVIALERTVHHPAASPGVAHAQSVPGSERDPDASLACYINARSELQLADRTAFLLCNGSSSNGPVQCYEAARKRTMLMDWQIVNLCRCASSATPVRCVERGRKNTFLIDDQLVQLCSAITTQQLRSNCAPIATEVPVPLP